MRGLTRLVATLLSFALVTGGCALTGNVAGNEVIAYFDDVGDLVVGGNVQVLDAEIGLVKDIELVMRDQELLAKVTMAIESDVEISATGLEALIRQTSLLGEQFVELKPTSEGPPFVGSEPVTISENDTERRVDVETFLGDLSAFVGAGGLEDLNRFTHSQALILEERGRRFGEVIEELEVFTGVLADRRADLGSAIEHLAAAGSTIARNQSTLDSFLDSLEDANVLLAEQGDDLRRLFSSLNRFGTVSARFLARHEAAINRQLRALRPVFRVLATSDDELRVDIAQLATFFELFPKSFGGGPGGKGSGDYLQADVVACEELASCNTKGEKGDVPGEGR